MTSAEFAALLKSYRARHGLTQAQASNLLGVSLRTWQNWEIARNRPPDYALANLAARLSMPLSTAAQAPAKTAAKKRIRISRSQNQAPFAATPASAEPADSADSAEAASHLATHLL